ncbi:DUF4407 domain-containing protein [Nocardia beijingensis]|uniref:DUF4407 domain-containing protein n=1 Tax=Nocardia beijingensis TaxID=95162 RepID=UPI001892D793|nr:DUF4407 domain-containing protein [Nocardia beijingensis]
MLDWVPEDRMRYTRLGAIVLNTAIMAGCSMTVALPSLVGAWWWLLLPVGFFWGYLIFTFDSWLVASTHGMTTAKVKVLAPRLVVSLLLGFMIAEPLVLLVFKPSIDAEIGEERKARIDRHRGRLTECNPIDGSAARAGDCAEFTLAVDGNPQPITLDLAAATGSLAQSKQTLDTMTAKLAELEGLARDECAGAGGQGLTGRPGEGPECKYNRAVADRFREDNQIERLRSESIALQQRVTELSAHQAEAQRTYAANLADAIAEDVVQKTENLSSRGILDDLNALGRLTEKSWYVEIASWLLRTLLVAIDCLPVLVKLLGKTSAYDFLVAQQLEAAKRSFGRRLNLREAEEVADVDVTRRRIDQGMRAECQAIDDTERWANAQREAEIAVEIDKLARRLEAEEFAAGTR